LVMVSISIIALDCDGSERHVAPMTTQSRPKATQPEDISRLLVERVKALDLDGIVELYEPDAVVAYPPGKMTTGREAIRALYAAMLERRPQFQKEEPLATLRVGNLALTSTRPTDDAGARAQVARQQPDGSWLRVLDRPEF
jgi:ketosteroid isomerase-like protein